MTTAITVNPVPTQAVTTQAAAPAAAQTWTTLMYRSLTRQQVAATLRAALTAQQATAATLTTGVATATTAATTAQTQLTAATTADTTARTRRTAAQTALTTANKSLATASKKKPRSTAAITKAKNAVTAATKTLTLRKTEAAQAATALTAAQASVATTATALTGAVTARDNAATAVAVTQQKITTLPTAYDLAAQASAISRDMVNQVRPGFAVTDTTLVYGTTVHKNVAYAFKRMVDDAKANGVAISGGGFRTKQRQIELRKINGCPDVWSAPSSSCRVPTAIPGRSLHEVGMAIDITSGGKTLTRTTPAFRWLSLHAKAYGFVNLPSEPWHWSVTGS